MYSPQCISKISKTRVKDLSWRGALFGHQCPQLVLCQSPPIPLEPVMDVSFRDTSMVATTITSFRSCKESLLICWGFSTNNSSSVLASSSSFRDSHVGPQSPVVFNGEFRYKKWVM
ncbi:hypothetical protein HAX54_026156 [Datura stramonium]|uniref:Uncharacterized protein n=1 Tax=Datura stramonium TaxID=4076 RepID=A0ABS8S7A8_DATST|nr:hypothetical protein [Datura stramonium]